MEHTERNASDVGERYHLKENETRGEKGNSCDDGKSNNAKELERVSN